MEFLGKLQRAIQFVRHRDSSPCLLEKSCMTHGEHMEAQTPMGLKGDSGDGNG